MAKLHLARGTTSKIARIFIQDLSSSTGAGLTGLVYNSSGLNAYYIIEGAASPVAITLATATVGTYTNGGFKEISSTNLPGYYEVGIPDLAFASGNSVLIVFKGATNMPVVALEFELDAINYQDAIRAGLTALPSANASASNGLLTVGTGSGQINPVSGGLPAATTAATGTAQAGGTNTITLQAGSSAVVDLYKGNFIVIGSGTGAGQSRVIIGYSGSTTFIATVSRPWTVQPDNTSTYVVVANPHPALDTNLNTVVGSYATGQDPATLLLTNPSRKILNNASDGSITIDLTTVVPLSDLSSATTINIAKALQAAFVEMQGAETESGTSYVKKNPDGTTARTFTLTLDTSGNPTARV